MTRDEIRAAAVRELREEPEVQRIIWRARELGLYPTPEDAREALRISRRKPQ